MAGEKPIRQSRDERSGPAVRNRAPLAPPLIPAPTYAKGPPRDDPPEAIRQPTTATSPSRHHRQWVSTAVTTSTVLTHGDQCLIFGGSEETHAELQETALRMERELDRSGRLLGDLDPAELAELAMIIDSPEAPTRLPCGSRPVWSSGDALRGHVPRGADRPLSTGLGAVA